LDNCNPLSANKTLEEVRWKTAEDLSALDGKPVRFRFQVKSGKLYSFWVSPDKSGASYGYVAAGEPGFTGPTDTVGVAALERRFPQVKLPAFWKGRLEDVDAAIADLRQGRAEVIARSPAGRPVYLVTYGPEIEFHRQANYNSAVGAGDPSFYARKTAGTPPIVFIVGPPHGAEVEGIVGLVNLLRVAETGKDMRGEEWPRLKENLERCRLLIVPLSNPDGRARCPYDSLVGVSVIEATRVAFGTRRDGTLYGLLGSNQRHPMKDDVGLLGASFNDDGINLMHDEFLEPMAQETKALLRVARQEAPNYVMGLFTLVRLALYIVVLAPSLSDTFCQLSECYRVCCHGILEKPEEELPSVLRCSAVESESEFIQVVVQVLGTDGALMGSHKPAFQQPSNPVARGQQALPHVRVLPYNFMSISKQVQLAIPPPAVCPDHASWVCRFLHSPFKACGRGVHHSAKPYSPDATVADFCRNQNQRFACRTATSLTRPFTTDVGLIHFNCSCKTISPWRNHGSPDFVKPCPRRPITAQSQNAFQPQRAGAILLRGYPPDRSKPKRQRLVRGLENRSRDHGHLVIAAGALVQHGAEGPRFLMTTARTLKAIRPAQLTKIITAGFLRRKPDFELRKRLGVILHDPTYYILCIPESSE
jgi:hypothetical protein